MLRQLGKHHRLFIHALSLGIFFCGCQKTSNPPAKNFAPSALMYGEDNGVGPVRFPSMMKHSARSSASIASSRGIHDFSGGDDWSWLLAVFGGNQDNQTFHYPNGNGYSSMDWNLSSLLNPRVHDSGWDSSWYPWTQNYGLYGGIVDTLEWIAQVYGASAAFRISFGLDPQFVQTQFGGAPQVAYESGTIRLNGGNARLVVASARIDGREHQFYNPNYFGGGVAESSIPSGLGIQVSGTQAVTFNFSFRNPSQRNFVYLAVIPHNQASLSQFHNSQPSLNVSGTAWQYDNGQYRTESFNKNFTAGYGFNREAITLFQGKQAIRSFASAFSQWGFYDPYYPGWENPSCSQFLNVSMIRQYYNPVTVVATDPQSGAKYSAYGYNPEDALAQVRHTICQYHGPQAVDRFQIQYDRNYGYPYSSSGYQ